MDDKTTTSIMRTTILLMADGYTIPTLMEIFSSLYPKQPNHVIEFVIRSGHEMYQSLCSAIHKAGGADRPIDELLDMTVMDLISKLATNGVRFTFEKQGDKK